MALAPVQFISDFMEDYPNYWLKMYEQGTTTPLAMATNKSGSPTVAKAEISAGPTPPLGLIKTAGNVTFIPYISEAYDAYIFPTEAEADANDTANAIQLADDVDYLQELPSQVGGVVVSGMVANTNLVIGDIVTTTGYTTKGDAGDNSYEVVAGGTGTDNSFTFIDLDNGLQAKALFPNGLANIRQAGAVGDGTLAGGGADDTLAIQTAINSVQLEIGLPPGAYRTTSTISTLFTGVKLKGMGNRFATAIVGDHVLGPVITVADAQCEVSDFIITASDTRNAAAVDTDNYGLQIGSTDSNFLTNNLFESLVITRQPSDAFHFGGEGVGTVFEQCSAQFNRGHGFFNDDGTTLGASSPERNGGVKFLNCRSQENGGNGYNGAHDST